METEAATLALPTGLVDYDGLIASGIWAAGAAPTVRTLQRMVAARRIPYIQLGPRLVRFDVAMVRRHIMATMVVRPVGPGEGGSGNVRRKYIRRARQAEQGRAA